MADNGAGRAGFRAYQRLPLEQKQCVPGFNFTSDQLFWVEILLYPLNLSATFLCAALVLIS